MLNFEAMTGQNRYAGLAVIQRLDLAGLRAEFDAAARVRSRHEMIRILSQVEIIEADWVADMMIANPRRYGY